MLIIFFSFNNFSFQQLFSSTTFLFNNISFQIILSDKHKLKTFRSFLLLTFQHTYLFYAFFWSSSIHIYMGNQTDNVQKTVWILCKTIGLLVHLVKVGYFEFNECLRNRYFEFNKCLENIARIFFILENWLINKIIFFFAGLLLDSKHYI